MKEKYNALFDKLAPIRSDEELLRAVLDRKAVNMSNSNEKKKFGRKAIIIPAVAAAVLICTTVGVSAAYEWNLSAALSDIFSKSAEKSPDDVTFKDFNFQMIGGKELNDVLKFDGYEVRFKGVSADPHNMILFYDVVMDDLDLKNADKEEIGISAFVKSDIDFYNYYRFQQGAAGTSDNLAMISSEESGKKIKGGINERNVFLGSEGNVAHFYLKVLFKGYTCTGKNITINMGNSFDALKEYDINFDFFDDSGSLDYMTETAITLSNGETGNITHVQVTPLSVCFRVSWGNTPVDWENNGESTDPSALSAEQVYNEFSIKLKDGTVMKANSFLSHEDGADRAFRTHKHRYEDGSEIVEYSQEPAFEWLYPVSVSDIEALIIGTTTVPIN